MKWLIRNLLTSKQKGTRGKLVNNLTAQTSPSHCSGGRFCKKKLESTEIIIITPKVYATRERGNNLT